MAKIILGFTGEIACGKGTATKYVVEKYQAASHRFSTMLRDVLRRLYLGDTRENMQKISTLLRQNFGEDLMAKVIFQDVQEDAHDIVVVDGVRRLADIKFLKELPQFKLIYVEADINKRYERIVRRGENPDDLSKTFDQFKKDHEAETEQQITGLKKEADAVIDNNGSLENLYLQIDEMLSKDRGL
jgi:dephospho-CoA kinase